MENWLSKKQFADASNKDAFINMVNAISNYSKEKSKESRTAKLWRLYIEYVYIVKEFLVAERTCNWYLSTPSSPDENDKFIWSLWT